MISDRLSSITTDIMPLHRQHNNNDNNASTDDNDKSSKATTTCSPIRNGTNSTVVKQSLHDAVKEKIMSSSVSSPHQGERSEKESERSSPVRLLRELFARNGNVIPTAASSSSSNGERSSSSSLSFQRPAKEVMEAYDAETCRAVRAGNIDQIRRLYYQEGKSLNGSNQFGESLLHMACRRGDHKVVEFMLREAKVHTNVRDDMGRNVFHDAFWTSKPNLEVMDVLLESVSPELLLARDIRGHTPFDYARKTHWDVWCKYLTDREDLLCRRLAIINSIAQ